jgi:hypothetical protein
MRPTVDEILTEASRHPLVKASKHPKATLKAAPGKTVIEYAERISTNWHNTTASIIKVAADCYSARTNLSVSEKRDLIERLPFGESMFSKLASIGEDKRLQEHQKLLPPSISTIDLLRKLTPEQFEIAKDEKVVRPDVTRDEIVEWKQRNGEKQNRPSVNHPEFPLALYCIYPEQLQDAEQHAKVWSAVVEMAESQGLKAANFTGENLIGQIKGFFSKKVVAA